ncbi:phosphatidylinositol-binding clathrin assembly protein LAP-like isoform X1 [Saccoglossus kowalevskii]
MSGQSVMDRMTAARHSITGSGLAKSVCKATTEELMGPKKKHLDYLLQCTHEPNVNIPQLGELLIDRSNNTSWVIVFKALVTSHHLCVYGNERYSQYLASRNNLFNLSNFVDRTAPQGYDMSTYVRRYAKYLNEKSVAYRTVAFDFCRVKRGKEDGILRTMAAEKLLKSLPVIQTQLDALLDFECSSNELTNGVINSCFLLLFKDSIRLFACYNDGIINLLEQYFDMNKKQCKEALDIYRKFLIRMERMSEFLKVAEQVGIDKGEIPDLAKAPSSLLDALEQHLASLEGKKSTAARNVNISSQVASSLTMTSNSLATIEAEEKRKAVEDEKRRLNQLMEQRLYEAKHSSPDSSPQIQPATVITNNQNNPFTSTPPTPPHQAAQPVVQPKIQPDLFAPAPPAAVQSTRPSDDLLALNVNPFAAPPVQASVPMAAPAPMVAPALSTAAPNLWGVPNANGFTNNNVQAIGADFEKAFGKTPDAALKDDPLGDILLPMSSSGQTQPEVKHIDLLNSDTGDLDHTLANVAAHLDINPTKQKKAEHNWTKAQPTNVRTGGAHWSPAQSVTTWQTMQPMESSNQQNPKPGGQAADWRGNAYSGHFTTQPSPAMQPMMGGMGTMPTAGMSAVPSASVPVAGGYTQYGMAAPQPVQQPMNAFGVQPTMNRTTQSQDPFGGL